MRAHLVLIDAQDSAGAAVPVRLASVDDRRLCHLDNAAWVPAIARLPTLAYDFYGGDFQGRITTPTGSFSVATTGLPDLGQTRFSGARVRVWSGELGADFSAFVLRFDGRVPNEPSVEAGIATFDCRPNDAWLDKPLLELFTGSGGAEGPDDMEGAIKPLILGNCRFAPGTLIDAVNLIYRVSCYGEVWSIYSAYDRVASLGASQGDFTTLAALLDADVPAGSWATCRVLGLVRLGAPADGQVSFDIAGDSAGSGGYVRKPGAIIGRIAEIAGGTVDAANLAALDAARPWNLSLVLLAQSTAREVIQELAGSVCAVAGVTLTGALFVQPLGFTAPALTLDAEGRSLPPVQDVTAQAMATPYWRHATNAEISWVVHEASAVATGYNYRGRWKAARTYRLDDMVDLENGSAWAFVSDTAQAGVTPGTDAAVWGMLAGPTTYSDGTPIDDLQPAEPGADVTSYIVGSSVISIECNGDGVPLPGQVPVTTGYGLFKGDANISASATWSVSTLGGTLTASIDAATGALTVSTVGVDQSVVRISADAGANTRHIDVQVRRSYATYLNGQVSQIGTGAKVAAYLTVPAISLYAYANGGVADYSPATGKFRIMLGTTDISSNFTFAIVSNPANLTASLSGNTYAVTGGLTVDSAALTMRATGTGSYTGVSFDLVFAVSRIVAGYQIVSSLPTTNNFEGRVVYLTTDDKLYRYTGSAWTSAVAAGDISGGINATQFAAGIEPVTLVSGGLPTTRITNVITYGGKLYRWDGAAYVATTATADLTGQITDAQIAAISAAKMTGQITQTQITDGAVSTPKLAAGSVIADKVAAGAIVASKLAITGENMWPDPFCQDLGWWKGPTKGSLPEAGRVVPANDTNNYTGGWTMYPDVGTLTFRVGGGKGYWQLWSGNSGEGFTSNVVTQVVAPSMWAKPNTAYELGIGCSNGSNVPCTFNIQCFDASGTQLTGTGTTSVTFAAGDQGTIYYRAQFTTPANCVSIRLYWQTPSGTAFYGFLCAGNISLREAAGGTLLVNGSVTADKVGAKAIVAGKIDTDAVTSGTIAAGAVNTRELVSGAVSTDKLVVQTSGNLLFGAHPTANPANCFFNAFTTSGIVLSTAPTGYPITSPVSGWPTTTGDWSLPDRSTMAVWQTNEFTSNYNAYTDIMFKYAIDTAGNGDTRISVKPNQNYEWSVYTGAHRCNLDMYIQWLDSAGNHITYSNNGSLSRNNQEKSGGSNLNNYKRQFVRAVSPANAAFAQIFLRKFTTVAGGGDSWMFFTRPQFAEAVPNASVLMDYVQPAMTLVNGSGLITGSVTAQAIAALAVTTDKIAAGAVTAAKIGVTELSAITANIGLLRTATTGRRCEIDNNGMRSYDSNGTLRTRGGVWTVS